MAKDRYREFVYDETAVMLMFFDCVLALIRNKLADWWTKHQECSLHDFTKYA